MDEAQMRHLEVIQSTITRLAGNSGAAKTWTVTLTAALFALAADKANPHFVWIALGPTVAFWYLDSYYLRQERLFRRLYDAVRTEMPELPLFVMDVGPISKEISSQLSVAMSRTLLAFYGSLVLTVAGVVAYVQLSR